MSENNQYPNSKVEAKDFVSGWGIAFILAGLGFSLPMLYLGAEIALNIGFSDALMAYGVSTLVLTLLSIVTTLIGNRSRLSTYMILQFPFGSIGSKLINMIIGISLLGWFSVALELLAQAIQETGIELIGVHLPLWIIVVVASLFITVTTIYGINSMEKLANYAVPLLSLFLFYAAYKAYMDTSIVSNLWDFKPAENDMTLFSATSTLIGASVLMPVLMADFSRFVKNDRHSLIAVMGLAIGTPVLYIISAIAAIKTGQVDIIQIMKSLSLVLPAFVLLFVSTWVTNATNLYSTALTMSAVSGSDKYRNITLMVSVVGTILALLQFSDYLFDFLDILGVLAPSIPAIYIIDFFWLKKQRYELEDIKPWGINGLISWVVSSGAALCTYLGLFQLTGAYFIDSFIIAAVVYGVLSSLRKF